MKIALALLALALPLASQDAPPSAEKAQRLFDRGKWSQAAEAYEAIAKADPENGEAWYRLGYSRHSLGEYGEAAAANERAVAFPAYRATSYYNLACARSLLGELDEAGSALDGAIEAGFLDFDLIQMDADLEALRKVRELPLPKARVFDSNRGRNGVVIPYLVQLPADYDPEREYPALASFAPGGGGPLATAWALDELWGDAVSEGDFIVLHLVAPDRGWFTHPSHHALEDLFKKVKREYDIEGDRFHFFGFGGGARSATTYSQMSKSYCRSLTLVSSTGWSGWDDGDLSDFKRIPVRQIVGAEDVGALSQARHVQEVFEKIGANASLTVLPDEDTLVPSLRKAELLAVIVAGLR